MRILCRLPLCVAYYFAVAVILLVSFVVNTVAFLVGWGPGAPVLKRPLRGLLQFLFIRWAWLMGVIGILRLMTPAKTSRKPGAGELWVMNHPSLLDASYLLKFVTNGTCIHKYQIGSNPLYGSTARLAQHIPNIGGADMVRVACEALGRGEDLLIFPEGTRTTHVDVETFKSGFALIAKRSKAVVNVMWMESPDDFMTRETPFWRVPKLPAEVTIEQIARIDGGAYESVPAILDAVKTCYQEKKSNAARLTVSKKRLPIA